MKKTVIQTMIITLLLICVFSHGNAQKQDSQQNLNYLKAGVGYFARISYVLDPIDEAPVTFNSDINSMHNGIAQTLEFGHKMKNGYTIGGRFKMGEIQMPYIYMDKRFWDKKYLEVYYIGELFFNYDFHFNKHVISPGAGFLLQYSHYSRSYFGTIKSVDGTLWGAWPEINERSSFEMGIGINLDYRYDFDNSLFCGIHIWGNTLYLIGPETISITPFLGVKF